jgi:hypothetical protein
MTGGVIQLVAYGKEDLFLTRDPQITCFKVIYRRHTNFAKEDIELSFTSTPDFGKRSTCLISPEADLIDNACLKITLPRIPKLSLSSNSAISTTLDTLDSITFNDTNVNTNVNITKFAWIKNIGHAMIKYVEVECNGIVVDRHYGEWMHLFSSLVTRNIYDDGFNKMIGNVSELTDFSETKDEYILYVPLYFWFCRSPGQALPLVSLQFSSVKINIELFELDKCYVISPTHYIKCNANIVNFYPYEYLYQKGSDNIERYGMFSYYDIINKRLYYTAISKDKLVGVPYDGDATLLDISTKNTILGTPKSDKYIIKGVSSDFSIKPDLNVKTTTAHRNSLKNIILKDCVVLAGYVYLDDDERYKFAQTKHDYLIEQLYYTPNVSVEGANSRAKLEIDQPCKLTVWVSQLDYISDFNDRFNYTDSHIYKRQYDNNHTDSTKIKIYNDHKVGEPIGVTLIDEVTIRLNSQPRISGRTSDYYETIQPMQHATNSLSQGSGMYSYALFPFDVAPSGTTNMSQIEFIELGLKMNYKIVTTQKAKFRSYSLCYNQWRVDSGISAPIFIR